MSDRPHPARSFSLGTLLTGLVLGSALLVAAAVTGVNYYFDTQLAEQAAEEEFTSIALRSTQAAARLGRRGERLAVAVQGQEALEAPVGETLHPLVRPMTQLMRASDNIFSLFVGYADDRYLEVSDLEATAGLRAAWNARPDERWVVVQIFTRDGRRVELRRYLGVDLALRRSEQRTSDYRPTTRPWYASARPGEVQRTAPYLLSLVGQRGISYTVGNELGTVAGSIVLLSSLDELLSSAQFPSSFAALIFDSGGRIIAGGGPDKRLAAVSQASEVDGSAPVYATLARLAGSVSDGATLRQIPIDGEAHFVWIQSIESLGGANDRQFIGITGRRSEILAAYRDQALLTLALSLAVALLLLPLALLATRVISTPIRHLAAESDKVRHRDYAAVQRVPTSIREVGWLSASMVSMAASIQDYEQKQRDLHDSFVRLIAAAIDQKSPYTGGHCARVPAIASTLAEAASQSAAAPFDDFSLASEAEQREFRIAAWLHDCGKITTPEHIVDKGAKLEALYNRIHEIRMRFEVLLRDAEIACLKAVHERPQDAAVLRGELQREQDSLREDFAFVAACNIGGEAMDDAAIERLRRIAARTWRRTLDDRLGLSPLEEVRLRDYPGTTPADEALLADRPEHRIARDGEASRFAAFDFRMQPTPLKQNMGELYNLSIRRGTLTEEDRYLINEHICATIEMLETLPWPDDLTRVPEIAGGHHEKMDGTGYPRGLDRTQLSTGARIMAIADVLEALTAADRPYKKAKTLSESLHIMRRMALDQHIDADLFGLLITSGAYRSYAEQWLDPRQIDAVDEEALVAGLPTADTAEAHRKVAVAS
ncbi:MAG: HD domain-containing phosphohydrolase [Halieaceae bacterium]|nr:HD domain-containing phosphohydrolase [Halieaceae bacterium]